MSVLPAASAAVSPWRAALRGVRRNKAAILSVIALALVILSSAGAPLYADHVAKTGPLTNHLSDYIELDGQSTPVVEYDGVPIGPTYTGKYFLGADGNGRDVMVRLLYGGRNSLLIGLSATLLSLLVGGALGILAGYARGATDGLISRALDVLWAFPVILLGSALGAATALGGIQLGPFALSGGSIWLIAFVVGLLNIVYIARPIRGAVLSVGEQAYVEAARAQGAGTFRIMRNEIFPNVSGTLLALFPIILTQAIALEAALSFLGAGVKQPKPSWGTMLDDGIDTLLAAPHLTLVPGGVLVVTILALTVLSDVVRDALDPRGTKTAETLVGAR
ncbi:MAG: ABC transporter permease [Solirubrobacteraceae bacterium]|nr:ABC transporter permease [Solirubrobacteraceae bacterium]